MILHFRDRQVYGNIVEPDQTAPDQAMFDILSASFGCIIVYGLI